MTPGSSARGVLGDTPDRDYGDRLDRFWAMCAPEARELIAWLGVHADDRVLDVGCGTGGPARLLQETGACVVGLDLAWPHVRRAGAHGVPVAQADASRLPLRPGTADVVWIANTLHHLPAPDTTLAELVGLLRPGGTLAVVQSSFLPDMVFSWDARLERAITFACRRHYAERYGLDPDALSAPRDWAGRFAAAGLAEVRARTACIDRVAPLDRATRDWLLEVLFRGHWLGHAEPYLSDEDVRALHELTDPASPTFCLDRADFHHVQTLTLVAGRRP